MSTNTASSSTANGAGSADPSAPRRNSKRPKYQPNRLTTFQLPNYLSRQHPSSSLSVSHWFTDSPFWPFNLLLLRPRRQLLLLELLRCSKLPACKPILTPKWVITAFLVVGIVFVPIGVASLLASRDVVEFVDRYDTECIPLANRTNKTNKVAFIQSSADKTCNRMIRVTKRMKQPIYVYYQLDNFYQNHRRYVKNRNDKQLKNRGSASETSECKPEQTTPDGKPIVPCGLIAWSLFNDTYSFSRKNQQLTVNKKEISWKSDREHKFGKDVFPNNFQKGTLIGGARLNETIPLSEQEDLIVWMRTAALPTFRKLYGKIEVDLEENDIIEVTLENNYNTYSFSGKKKLVLSTTSWLGGKNDFLGIAYLTVGSLCFFSAMSFTVVYLVKPR